MKFAYAVGSLASLFAVAQVASATGSIDFQNCFVAPLNALDAESTAVSAPPFSPDCCALLSYGDLSFLSRAWARAGNRTFWPGLRCLSQFVGADANGRLSREQIQGLYVENPTLTVSLLGRLPVDPSHNDAASLSFYRSWRGKATLTPLQPSLLDLTIVPRAALLDLYLCDASFTAASLEASEYSSTSASCLLAQDDIDAMARRTLLEGHCPSLPYTPMTPWYDGSTGSSCSGALSCVNRTLPNNSNVSYFDLNCSNPHSGDLRVLAAIKVPCFLLFPASVQSMLSPQYVELHMERLGSSSGSGLFPAPHSTANGPIDSIRHAVCCSANSGGGSDCSMAPLLAALNQSSLCHSHQCQPVRRCTPIMTDHADDLCPFLEPCTATAEPTTVYLTSSVPATAPGPCSMPTGSPGSANASVPSASIVNVTTGTACPTTITVTSSSSPSPASAASNNGSALTNKTWTALSPVSSTCFVSVSTSTVTVTLGSSSGSSSISKSSSNTTAPRSNTTATARANSSPGTSDYTSRGSPATVTVTAVPTSGHPMTMAQCNDTHIASSTDCLGSVSHASGSSTTIPPAPLTKVTQACHVNGSTLYFEYYTNSTANGMQAPAATVAASSMDSFLSMCGSALRAGDADSARPYVLSLGVMLSAVLLVM